MRHNRFNPRLSAGGSWTPLTRPVHEGYSYRVGPYTFVVKRLTFEGAVTEPKGMPYFTFTAPRDMSGFTQACRDMAAQMDRPDRYHAVRNPKRNLFGFGAKQRPEWTVLLKDKRGNIIQQTESTDDDLVATIGRVGMLRHLHAAALASYARKGDRPVMRNDEDEMVEVYAIPRGNPSSSPSISALVRNLGLEPEDAAELREYMEFDADNAVGLAEQMLGGHGVHEVGDLLVVARPAGARYTLAHDTTDNTFSIVQPVRANPKSNRKRNPPLSVGWTYRGYRVVQMFPDHVVLAVPTNRGTDRSVEYVEVGGASAYSVSKGIDEMELVRAMEGMPTFRY
jgi:hypothetical protein